MVGQGEQITLNTNQEIKAPSFLMITFQRIDSKFLRNITDLWVVEDLHLKAEEIFIMATFSKVNALRKGRSRASSQKDTCLKFGKAEGNIKAF